MTKRRRGRGEGAVFFSASKGVWVGRAVVGVKPNGGPKYREVTARSKGDLLAKMRKVEADARSGLPTDGKPMTVSQYLQHWLDAVSKPTVRETTWESYERCVRLHLKPHLGGHKLAELRPHHVEAFFAARLKDGMSRGNAKKVGEVLASALEHATRTGLVASSASSPITKPQPEEGEVIPFTSTEVKAILMTGRGARLGALVALAFATGMRQGELLGLGWTHVDLDAGVVRVERALVSVKGAFILKEPKSKRGRRVIEVPRFALDALATHREAMLAEGNIAAAVFCTRTGAHVEKSNFISKVWKPLLKKAGVAYRKFHTVRHTHISELLAKGESVVDVARRVGDRPDVILKTYAHFIPGNQGRIASRLDEMYG